MKLFFNPPYNWKTQIDFLTPRTIPGLESIGTDFYRRTISLDGECGAVEIRPQAGENYLVANIHFPKVTSLDRIVERLRHIFDLNANVTEIAAHLQSAPELDRLVRAMPGIRIPGGWDSFELAVRAILEQQVSVAAAKTLTSRLVKAYGKPLTSEELPVGESELLFIFPTPEAIASANLTELGIVRTRAFAINTLAKTISADKLFFDRLQNLDDAVNKLCELPGIGEWTANYIAMRALREPDAFPANDLGLLRAIERLGYAKNVKQLRQLARAWQPWRAYAAMYLWFC